MLVLRLNDNLVIQSRLHGFRGEIIHRQADEQESPARVQPAGAMETTVRELSSPVTQPCRPVAFRGERRELDDLTFCRLLLVAFQRRQFHLGLASVRAMHRLAVVAERLLCKSLGITPLLRPLAHCWSLRLIAL